MKKLLAFALLSMSFGIFGDSADEALFVDHPVLVNQYRPIESDSIDGDVDLELSENDSDESRDLEHDQNIPDQKRFGTHHNPSFTHEVLSPKLLKPTCVDRGCVAFADLKDSLFCFEGSSRAPPRLTS